MSSATYEFVVSHDLRRVGAGWSHERRARYLLRPDVAVPLSLDARVLPPAEEGDHGELIELVAVLVPTAGSPGVAQRWLGSELPEPAPAEPEFVRAGYDVCDETGLSGLSNCAFDARDAARFRPLLNAHHLFTSPADADAYRATCDAALPEHAPFAVIALYVRAR